MEEFRFKTMLREIGYIVFRNVFLLTNGILFAVALLLVFFGNFAGWFLLIILFLNIVLGLFQDIRAWAVLQKLQFLTAPRAMRINKDGSRNSILVEEIKRGDLIALKIGDQVPCDGELIESKSFEINEGLITGESTSILRFRGEKLLAGSVVTSGTGIMRAQKIFKETRIARMTESIQRYSVNVSPIQKAVNSIIKYSIFVLMAGIVFVVARGIAVGSQYVHIVTIVGSITSMFVPQGLVFAITLFFSYGAAHLFRRQVLLQEVSATEKLGRIKNLCMDKTGTLTKNEIFIEISYVSKEISEERAQALIAAYIKGTGDTSQIIQAIEKTLKREYAGEIFEALSFSSWRGYGAVRVKGEDGDGVIFVGLPDRFLNYLEKSEQQRLKNILSNHAPKGKRLLCVLWSDDKNEPLDISKHKKFSLITTFVFSNPLREGIGDTVNFFQDRGIKIRIISGDNAETTQAIAAAAGINDADKIITGKEIEAWREADFYEKVGLYAIFAGVVPEQKEKIIDAFKRNGFTAMIGDGANDALAIKKADLGIAMFDGAPATRQLASIVLMNNSFAALPGGVELADMIIRNVEIFSGLFLFQAFLGFFFFVVMSFLGRDYPLTPLNISFMNYFTIGIPGLLLSYWTLKPRGKVNPEDTRSFLKRILPFTIWSAILETFGVTIVYFLSPSFLKSAESNTLVVLSFIALNFLFFIFSPAVYQKILTKNQKLQLLILGLLEVAMIAILFSRLPFLVSFFTLTPFIINLKQGVEIIFVILIFGYFQYQFSRWIIKSR